jgi:HAD superfamily hydrolase (TIGR01549 family)
MRTHDAWLIDLDGTLYVPKPVKWAMAGELLLVGVGAVAILRQFRRQHELLREENAEFDPSPFDEQIRRTAEAARIGPAEVQRIVGDWMFNRPCKWLRRFRRDALLEEIKAFRDEGGRTALVSDYPAQVKLAALEVTTLFDRVIASGEPGGPKRMKPSPEGLLLAAASLEAEPKRCLVIGDRQDADGAAAAAAGMEFRLVR